MDDNKRQFFMMTVEIRILAALLARISHRSFEGRFGAADISGLQFGILRSLGHQSNTISELSRKFMLDPSTLVPVIDTLERKGLVARGKDPNDRRRIPVSLTDQGTNLINSVQLAHEDDVLYQCLDRWGRHKTRILLKLLREVVKHLPDGEEMLNSVSARLYTLQDGENASSGAVRGDCIIHHREQSPN
jgi:DNA-binding MarR family transcriptional regulator